MKKNAKNIVLFYCPMRNGYFGQGTFVNTLIPYFSKNENFNLTIIETDCNISEISFDTMHGMDIVSIPNLSKHILLTGEDNVIQKSYARKIVSIIYPVINNKKNLIFWINSIDYLNVCNELKIIFEESKIMYVHHSFSWKYYLNISDVLFEKMWKEKQTDIHPQAFELTKYQQDIAKIADVVITVTKHAKSMFGDILGIDPNKIHVIYNGSSIPSTSCSSKKELRKKYGFGLNEKILLFSGRITSDKGLPYLLEAFKILIDRSINVRLIISGIGRIFDFIKTATPYWSKITITGAVEQSQLSELYCLSDIGILPSLHEQCSYTAIEMRLHKLPVIVSAVDGLDEVFKDGFDSFKVPVEIDATNNKYINPIKLADKIEEMLKDKLLSRKLAKKSYRVAKSNFLADKMMFNYSKVLTYFI